MSLFTESVVEDAALAWLEALGYAVLYGPEIAAGEPAAERNDPNYRDVVLEGRLRLALVRLNPDLPPEALEDAFRKLTRAEASSLVEHNRAVHRMLVDGVTVEYRRKDGSIAGAQARVLDFDAPDNNDWLAVNQFSVAEGQHVRRPDMVLFVNGLPLAVIELKNPADENADIWTAFRQFQTYKSEIPSLFAYNGVLAISDGLQARVGTLSADRERFMPWRTITGAGLADGRMTELQVMLEGMFEKRRFLDLVRHFVVFEDMGGGALVKKMAGYHQYHAVNVAVEETLRACEAARQPEEARDLRGEYSAARWNKGRPGDRRIGVVWHTQGSGKSLTMAFYAGRVIVHPAMENPTVVVITDRNDLDEQLFGTFARCQDLLRQAPVQAESRADLRTKLSVASGGVVFTTIQKFMPPSAAPSPAPSPSPKERGTSKEAEHYRGGYHFSGLAKRVRELRQKQTAPEAILWEIVRDRQFMGMKFRRQHQIGDYVVDFYCHEAKLAVELDGLVHGESSRRELDASRDAYLRAIGVEVARFRNDELLTEPQKVLSAICDLLPSTSGRGVGREGSLSLRRNIVVIADEAHRSQYDFIDGFARHMHDALPNASFIGFTGTPIEKADANTRAVFGDYISIYDIQRAVLDEMTVPIYYESRLAKLELKESERPKLDLEFEEVTEGEEVEQKERHKSKWTQLEALVGTPKRLKLIAQDLVNHFEGRLEAMDGKAMVVCMSRRICVDLYNAIVALRPSWHSTDDEKGEIKIVMTGSASDPVDWQPHIRNKARREALAKRFKGPRDPFRVVLVRDMWLTGFDVPCLHTMYVDKPMRGHALMQAIARVNRVFKDKPGGLVVDYLGLADQLRSALATYAESGGKGKTAIDQEEAVALMLEKYEICCGLFYGFDRSQWTSGSPQERLNLLPYAQECILGQENGSDRLVEAVKGLSQAFALAVPHPEAIRIRDDVGFFQAVRAALLKRAPSAGRPPEELDFAIRQLVSDAITSDEVVDIFAAAGLKKPDISILSDEFLAEIRGMPQRNLAVEVLSKLLSGEIKSRFRKNVVQAGSFAEMLEEAIRRYQNRAIETAQVIEELIQLAKQMREEGARGGRLKLSEDELAFYDALETNDSAVKVLGEPTLKEIARELAIAVRNNVTIDWTMRENVRAKLRVLVKRILRKHGYPPDKQEKATQTVLEQAEVLSEEWATA